MKEAPCDCSLDSGAECSAPQAMDVDDAIAALAALGQKARLDVFRLLVRAGPEGMSAGDIARAVGAPANTMSVHLGILARAGLISSQRDGRSIRYALEVDGIQGLFAFLMSDCCGGRPELCGPFVGALKKPAPRARKSGRARRPVRA